jgi:glycine hydroxymethyltransferase
MSIVLGSDHGGFDVKEAVKQALAAAGETVLDVGCASRDSVDYPDVAEAVGIAITDGQADRGILVCTTGIGMSIAANRFPSVRAALCGDAELARISRDHNDSNVLVLPGKRLGGAAAAEVVKAWLATPFSGSERHARRNEKNARVGNRVIETATVRDADPEVYAAIRAQVAQEDGMVNLIASENTVTRAVREAQGSVLTNKYAEGYPGKRWYGGCTPSDTVERLAIERAKQLFGADHANVQPHCGSAANMAVYFSVLQPGDTILSMSLDQGGHLTHGSPVNFSGKFYKIVPYTVDPATEVLDYAKIEALAMEHRPKMIVAGASAYPRILDFPRFRAIADRCGALLLVDMAHIAGLVAGGAHPNPVPYAEFVSTTTHKTLRGPRSGMVLCRKEFAAALDKTVFPGLQGGPLEHTIAAKAVCFKEALSPEFREYARQIVENSTTLCGALKERGFRIVSGGTENHLMLVDVAASGLTGKEASAALEAAGIIVNKNTIPFDKSSPFVTSGIRIGTAAATTRGMRAPEMVRIGNWIADTLSAIGDADLHARIRRDILAMTAGFPVP